MSDISAFKKEKEIIYPAFSFFYVEKVEIDYGKQHANIYLETIGKKCILEEAIKKGKEIEYIEYINKEKNKEKIIQIKK